jgi:hypothetical protein
MLALADKGILSKHLLGREWDASPHRRGALDEMRLMVSVSATFKF